MISGGGTGEYLALFCWLAGGALLALWIRWSEARAPLKLRAAMRRRAVEERDANAAPTRQASADTTHRQSAGAPSSRAGVAPEASARCRTSVDAAARRTVASTDPRAVGHG